MEGSKSVRKPTATTVMQSPEKKSERYNHPALFVNN